VIVAQRINFIDKIGYQLMNSVQVDKPIQNLYFSIVLNSLR